MMFHRGAVWIGGLLLLLSEAAVVSAADWKTAAREKGLTPSQIRQLARDKILITEKSCLQIFGPYVEPEMPVFITSDSILNAYHVLLEESVLRLEQANAAKLPEILRFVWENLETIDRGIQGKPDLVKAAKTRAQIVIGTAIRLLGDETIQPEPSTAELIAEEVGRVQAAGGEHRPKWLGPAGDPGLLAIDYSRYKPRGFYADVDALGHYFRAVSWLQSIPFQVDRDEELLAILMLGNCVAAERFAQDEAKRQQCETFFECFRELLGERDDWDLISAAKEVPGQLALDLKTGKLEGIRQSLVAKAARTGHRPQINDQIAFPQSDPAAPIPLSFRVVSAYRTPDAILFGRTTNPLAFSRSFPTGLEVCIALGSSYAAQRLDDAEREKVLKTIEESADLFSGSSLYFDYLDCVSALLDEPPAAAPAFMSSGPWQAKSCQTTLAGWAQLRHTWALQSKQTVVASFEMDREQPVGFVEPDPEFFGRFQDLAQRTRALMVGVDTRLDLDLYAIVELKNLLRVLETKVASGEGLDEDASPGDFLTSRMLNRISGMSQVQTDPQQFLVDAIRLVRDEIENIRRGEISGDKYVDAPRSLHEHVEKLWQRLATLSGRLRTLAEKQLAGQSFSSEERDFILHYGEALAPLMFHFGHASETPRDDVPRVIDVVHNPILGKYLEVGVGRPRIMYVLYPGEDGEVFCRGAVLPYYEFQSDKRLNDAEWKTLLDSPDVPDPPEWLNSSRGSKTESGSTRTAIWIGAIVAALAIPAIWLIIRRRQRTGKM